MVIILWKEDIIIYQGDFIFYLRVEEEMRSFCYKTYLKKLIVLNYWNKSIYLDFVLDKMSFVLVHRKN